MPTEIMQKTKTKTVVGIALAVATIGTVGFVAGLYYYGQRINYISSKSNCNCPTCQTCPKCAATDTSNSDSDSSSGGDTSGGNVDLVVTSFKSPGAGSNNLGFSSIVTVKNNGTDSAGSFKVKIYLSIGGTLTSTTAPAQLLVNGTQTVAGLGAGQSTTLNFTGLNFNHLTLHTYYKIIAVVDADNEVNESNENSSCPGGGNSNVKCGSYEVL